MPGGDAYRAKAADFAARAITAETPSLRTELEGLALSYLRLAEQADRNSGSDLVYETPPKVNTPRV
jgi:hypothetical protein